ncbi:MAG: class I SAM-dependent methyltransferase [Clostridiales bacterium]|nr:class I SAM-dependent methyltransferase [Clostridiales bacterium]
MKNKVKQPEGNYFDKYNSNNLVVKKMMAGFFGAYEDILNKIDIIGEDGNILEAGCGEGEVTDFIYHQIRGANIEAFDISEKVISIAKKRCEHTDISFRVGSIYNIGSRKYDLVICSEVLEHLEYPEKALEQLKNCTNKYIICSVPREPIWRILNMVRGKYIRELGNTPGHINHWSRKSFLNFLQKNGCEIVDVKNPLPWTVVLLKSSCKKEGK